MILTTLRTSRPLTAIAIHLAFINLALLVSGAAQAEPQPQPSETPNPFNIDLTPDNSSIVNSDKPQPNLAAPSQSPISSAIQNLNPDISFLGDLISGNPAALSLPGQPSRPPVYIREVEIDAAGYVSPYAKGFFVTSLSSEGADIEEAYMNFFNLPLSANVKLGKARTDIDTLNPLHPHAYPFVDSPLILEHLFGPEGLKATGGNLSFLVPNPWDHYLLLSGNVLANPDNEDPSTALYGGSRQSIFYTLRASTSFDLAADTYLIWNISTVQAPLVNGLHSRTYITDLLLRIAPNPVSDAYTLLSGFYWNRQDPQQTGSPFIAQGMYAYTGYQFSPRWKIGYRYDIVNDPNPIYGGKEQQHNGILSFYPTETNYLRFQYGYHQLPGTAGPFWENRIWFQVNWSMGPHALHMNL